ncbi:MAG: phosphomannose isomerase type II C-terminal cupin domain [Lactobacillaceae bacterium]|jgi:mannose-6-phosphate isomerase-like protein (cupin superfamily)|nr:phosphomannose isomerase type II C-terminal cupin domain [Lactobacillaceae bacterium]
MGNNYRRGDKDTRPWGTWEVLDSGDGFCVKRIMVTPGNILSLQLHHHRAEHWIIVKGEALVTLGENKIVKKANESIYIPVETKHRIQNDTNKDMEFIEIQTGETLDENDIVRFEDTYGRV